MIINLVKNIRLRCTRGSSLYLTLIEGPLRCRKQWFHNGYKYKRNFNQDQSSSKSNSFSSSSNVKIPGVLTLSICGYLAMNYEYYKAKLLEIMPKVQGLTVKDLSGRRKQFNFIATVAELSAPAVVYIEIRDTKKFDYYTGQPTPISNGSGFIIEPDGLILTNAHVVIDNALRSNISVLVKLLDGRSFEGKVEHVDRVSDLATVRIKCSNLPTLRLGCSSTLKAGEWVVALGSPLALSNTVTCGIISAYRRAEELGLHRQKIVYLQTDAAINQGNSGGPLMNLNGEAIGINSMKILPGISFAIPMDHAKKFLRGNQDKRFQQKAQRTRYIGITMLTLDESLIIELRRRKCSLSENVKEGVLIWKVIPDSPAARGGLNPGDIVTHVNGKEVKNSSDIYDALLEKGKKLDMTVYRGLKQLRIVVEPEE